MGQGHHVSWTRGQTATFTLRIPNEDDLATAIYDQDALGTSTELVGTDERQDLSDAEAVDEDELATILYDRSQFCFDGMVMAAAARRQVALARIEAVLTAPPTAAPVAACGSTTACLPWHRDLLSRRVNIGDQSVKLSWVLLTVAILTMDATLVLATCFA